MAKPFINIKETDLSKFNAGDIVQFTPYFIYDNALQNVGTVNIEIPKFPSLLKDLKAERLKPYDQVDAVLDSTSEFRITSYIKPKNNLIQIFLEKEWYYPRDNSNAIVQFDKTGVVDRSASTLLPKSIIVFTASPGNSASPLNNIKLELNKINNSPPATRNKNNKVNIPTTGSVVLEFTATLPSAIPTSNSRITVNTNTAALSDYTRYEKYNTWRLSVSDNKYAMTLNNNNYIKDFIIFSYTTNNGKERYLINSGKIDSKGIDVSDPTVITYSNISSFYIDTRNNNNPKFSIQTRIYNSVSDSSKIQFFGRVVRFIDTTGTGNFSLSKANILPGQDWVEIKGV